MKIKRSCSIVIIALGLIMVTILLSLFKKDLWDENSKLLKEKVLSVAPSSETINLVDITPFEWDVVYSFEPYTPKEKVYNTVGYKWANISESVNEEMNQIVFLKDGKVVCYLHGYPSNNGYGISFDSTDYKSGIATIHAKDNANFKVTKNKNIIYLENGN